MITANGSRKEKNNNLDSDSVIMIRRFAERTKELRSKCKPIPMSDYTTYQALETDAIFAASSPLSLL